MSKYTFRTSQQIYDDIRHASARFSVGIFSVGVCEIIRRAWRSYEKGNVDISQIEKVYTPRNCATLKQDISKDLDIETLNKVLTAYLAKYKDVEPPKPLELEIS